MAKLYIVATPIGNLGDITFRAVEILKEVDLILCEDTRQTKKLLDRYKIKKPTMSYHQRSKLNKTDKIIEKLESGKDLALVTDAGTPGISDPGNELVERVLEHFEDNSRDLSTPSRVTRDSGRDDSKVEIIPIPGPSAMTTLASVAGINLNKFVFLGFPPNKKGRETFFKKVLAACYPVVYYESPYRLLRNLILLQKLVNEDSESVNSKMTDTRGSTRINPAKSSRVLRDSCGASADTDKAFSDLKKGSINLIVGRELTKIHEEVVRGNIKEIINYFEENSDKVRGEFVVIIHKT